MTDECCGERVPFRIGLLVDASDRSSLAGELIDWAAARDDVEIGCTIVDGAARGGAIPARGPRRAPHGALAAMLLAVIYKAEARLLGAGRSPSPTTSAAKASAAGISLAPSRSRFVYTGTIDDLGWIRALDLDMLVQCGSEVADDAVLGLCPFGVLSLRLGKEWANRAGPVGFREVYDRSDETGFTVERLGAGGAANTVLFRGAIQTQAFYFSNLRALQRQSTIHMIDLLAKAAATRRLPPALEPMVDDGPSFGRPGLPQLTVYVVRACARVAHKVIRRLSGRRTRWSIGLLQQDSFPAFAPDRHSEVRAAPGRSWADPFLWRRDNRLFCLVEDYAPGGRGHIAALEVRGSDLVSVGEALKEDFHLSFPFLFEHEGEVFLCPETQEAREIRVYSTTSFPLGWRHRATLMRDVAAVDTMLFPQAGRWWMLTTLDRAGTGANVVELNLFHAADPLSSDWTAHPCNPILVSPAGGRNAGMTVVGGRRFRFGQRQGFDRYGRGLLIFEITRLSVDSYEERLVGRIDPDFAAIEGVHHLSVNNGLAVFDMAKIRR